ncbi:molybdopterin synthase [Haloarchaeobius iranensis]|uniref:Molybdopterin synthase subunit MoaE /molybdopterin guanine dinucleotide biosynthesis accessory protein MobB n=1 Tax=Haloarchaeobius iranensis TaxID=996166 RepID=A0A1G9YBQ1_9EURY|nr:molybdopterin synthase [Haloarchaeobius iranensis]SDN05833.1 molybdopterin synthase subunit MoaE /molybdopterin guanine dinucleotide biosynthesis accessory protein MobB [Haloarchaeobius iranensis]
MYVLAVVGPDGAGRADLVDQFVGALAADGTVAVVTEDDPVREADGLPGASDERVRTSVGVGSDGWAAAGTDRTLDDVVDDLTPTHDYCLLDDVREATVPGVVLGGVDYAGDALTTVETGSGVDVDAVVTTLHERIPHETLDSLVERATGAPGAEFAGAIATFTGRVRARDDPDDERTTHLEFETYEGVAEERMATIEADLEQREGVHEVVMHHRTGVVAAGEDIVFVVVLAGHRPEAFETVSDGIDRLKDEVPIFKKEATTDGEFWVHERDTGAE